MQKDFHYDVVYVLAKWAGFNDSEAYTVAYASQYVDDANNSGHIEFYTGESYTRTSSAHETYDVKDNADNTENHNVWLPFHFLPGYCGETKDVPVAKDLFERVVCTPDSFVAREMLQDVIRSRDESYGLHRFGIAIHTYADTWAHRGFAGVSNRINKVAKIVSAVDENDKELLSLKDEFLRQFPKLIPVGHGTALHYPDLPYVKEWKFTFEEDRERGEQTYNNTDAFIEAADFLLRLMRLFLGVRVNTIVLADNVENLYGDIEALSDEQRDFLRKTFIENNDDNGDVRHEKWLELSSNRSIQGVGKIPDYAPKGIGSWKYEALHTVNEIDGEEERFTFTDEFFTSDWKKFHDALQIQRQYILLKLLPKYGICVS